MTYQAIGPGVLFLDSSGVVSLNGKPLHPKPQESLLQDVKVGKSLGYELAGISLRRLQAVPDEEKRSSIHEVDGYSYLGEDTTPKQARIEAISMAKRQALEMARVLIESNSMVKDGKLQYDFIQSGAQGSVSVLEQKDLGFDGNRYHVWIRAEVSYGLKDGEKQKEPVQPLSPDAPLTVKVWTTEKQYRTGDKVEVYMTGNRDFYARIVNVDSEGNITQLLPNDYRSTVRFAGGRLHKVPDTGDHFAIKVMDNFGEEAIVVYASEVPLGDVKTRPVGSGLRGYGGSQDQLAREMRAIKPVPKAGSPDSGAGFYEATWKFTTSR